MGLKSYFEKKNNFQEIWQSARHRLSKFEKINTFFEVIDPNSPQGWNFDLLTLILQVLDFGWFINSKNYN